MLLVLLPQRGPKTLLCSVQRGRVLISHQPLDSLVVQATAERSRQQPPKAIPSDKGHKWLDFLGRKVFSSISLLFRILNYRALQAKYDFTNYANFLDCNDKVLEEDTDPFQALIDEANWWPEIPFRSRWLLQTLCSDEWF